MRKKLSPATVALLALTGSLPPGAAPRRAPAEPTPLRELTERDKMRLAAAQAKRDRKGAKRLAAMAREQNA